MNIKKHILILWMTLIALSAGAINYPTYDHKGSSFSLSAEQEQMPSAHLYSAEQLTSPILYSEPMIGEDGTAIEPCTSAPRRTDGRPNAGTGETGRDENTYQPVGDALLPLLLMAAAYILIILLRNIHLKHKQSIL